MANCSGMQYVIEADENTVLLGDTLDALVEHYRQPIHLSCAAAEGGIATTHRSSNVYGVLLKRIHDVPRVTVRLLELYPSKIEATSGGVVLQFFERMIADCSRRGASEQNEKASRNSDAILFALERLIGQMRSLVSTKDESSCPENLLTTIKLVRHALAHLTLFDDTVAPLLRRCICAVMGMEQLDRSSIRLEVGLCSVTYFDCEVSISDACNELHSPYFKDNFYHNAIQEIWGEIHRLLSRLTKESALQELGWRQMADAIHAQFFARDQGITAHERVHLGRTVTSKVSSVGPISPVPIQSRAALFFFSLLKKQDQRNVVDNKLLARLVPIVYELLNGAVHEHIYNGVCALTDLLDCHDECWPTVLTENICTILSENIKTVRDGRILAALGIVQGRLFFRLCKESQPQHIRQRQGATQQLLLILERNNHHYTQENLVWGALLAVTPLLYGHAVDQDGVELGRLGLSAILPIIRYCGSTFEHELCSVLASAANINPPSDSLKSRTQYEVQIVALVALANTLIGAYPIMARHEGKILSELIGFVVKVEGQREIGVLASEVLYLAAKILCSDGHCTFLDRLGQEYGETLSPIVKKLRCEISGTPKQHETLR